ncbi:MAG TPA: AraC family transcriptional regulator [Bryobacteraceae bacterium]|nr:AraC family transcriptional regulator [Bryobacteraceae bacterium]
MIRALQQIQPAIGYARLHPDADLSLHALAEKAEFIQRLRLDRGAALLLTGSDFVLEVALAYGFQSHESFCRAFGKRFGIRPSEYRKRGLRNRRGGNEGRDHADCLNQVGPCIGFFHVDEQSKSESEQMDYSITKTTLQPQPALVVRRTIKRSEIAATIGEVLQKIFLAAQTKGVALMGPPFMRCLNAGPGLMTIEPGMRVSGSASDVDLGGEIVWETLPGGEAATTVHMGKYEDLPEAYAAMEQWMKAEGLRIGGAPWEVYVTDPGDHPDPKDWKTEIFWPLA